MQTVLTTVLLTGAVMTGAIAATPASAQSESRSAQLAYQLDQNGVTSAYMIRGGRGGGRVGGGYRGGHAGRVGGMGRVGGYGGRVGYGGRYGYGRRGWGYGTGAAVAGGLAAGALVGGAVAGSPYYYGNTYGAAPVYADPEQSGSVDSTAYCVQRFRSYDPGSGTYLGNDGLRHTCP